MSSQLKEKQQQKDNKRDLDADSLLNQHLFRTLAYAGAGFGAGLVASVFFKHRKAMTLLGAGSGAAYGASNFMNELNQYGRFKDLTSQSQQPHTLMREDQTSTKNWDNFMPKQESVSQKRFGGSDDDDNKSKNDKAHESTPSRPKTDLKKPSESLHSSSVGTKEAQNLNPKSTHDTTLDKSSHDFGRSKNETGQTASLNKDNDKSNQHSGNQKSNAPKSSSPSHKESDKSSHDQHKSESPKNVSHGKEQQKSGKESEKNNSSKHESKSDIKLEEGQHLQDFKSNTKEAGRPAPGDSKEFRGSERPRQSSRPLDENAAQHRTQQDRWGHTSHTGITYTADRPSETKAGHQFNDQGITSKNQIHAEL